MLIDTLKWQLNMSASALGLNLEGVTDDEALLQPEPAGNCLNWVAGHILASREGTLEQLGEARVWDPDVSARYTRGSAPVGSADDALVSLTRIRRDLEQSQARFLAGLDRLTPADLEAPVKGDQTFADRLAFLLFHETYHVGQTGLLRRLIGKPGAIR